MEVKHPEVNVKLIGEDGNAFAILGRTTRAMRLAGVPAAEIDAFRAEATSGDYNNLLQTVMRWVATDEEEDAEEDEFYDDTLCEDPANYDDEEDED